MKFFLLVIFCGFSLFLESSESFSESNSQMFSLSPEEMVFASKLSDENRHRFCYKFSFKERSLAMSEGKESLSPNEKVEQVFSAFNSSFKSKGQVR